jgi:hypothetical protein
MSRIFQILLCAAALGSAPLRAQVTDGTQPPAPTQTPPPAPAIDPTKLGISFDRVRLELAHPAPAKNGGLKIQETIQVVGVAPPILLWDPKTIKATLTSQAVPYGAPTQKDIMKLIVPKEFQNYPFDMNALMQWLMDHLNKKSQ